MHSKGKMETRYCDKNKSMCSTDKCCYLRISSVNRSSMNAGLPAILIRVGKRHSTFRLGFGVVCKNKLKRAGTYYNFYRLLHFIQHTNNA